MTELNLLETNPISFNFENRFIVVEGIDGSGKSTLVNQLARHIQDKLNNDVYLFRQPGGNMVGERIRNILKDIDLDIHPRVRHLLLEANRVGFLTSMVSRHKAQAKAKQEMSWTISDRHRDSTWAYQGSEEVSNQIIRLVQESYLDLPEPDLTIFLDIEPGLAISRIWASRDEENMDKYDRASIEFFDKVIKRYYERIRLNRNRYFVVDANKSEQEVFQSVINNIRFK